MSEHFILCDIWNDMVKRELAASVQPLDFGLYTWVDPELVGTIFLYSYTKKVEDVTSWVQLFDLIEVLRILFELIYILFVYGMIVG